METDVSDTALDGIITAQITAASRALIDETARELAPPTTATRRFEVTDAYVDLAPFDLRNATAVQLDPDVSPVTLTAHVDYELWPAGGDKDGVYTAIKLSRYLSLMTTKMLAFGFADLSITGAWGYATVPESAKQACIVAARSWVRRDLATYAALDPAMRDTQPLAAGTYALPKAAKSLVAALYRYPAGASI